jgi:hypothetical protein
MNIQGATEKVDMAYRYKMPEIDTRTEGKCNKLRTKIVNMKSLAQSLVRRHR